MKKISLALALLLSAPSLLSMNVSPIEQVPPEIIEKFCRYVFQTIEQDSWEPLTQVRAAHRQDYEWLEKHAITNKVRTNVKLDIITQALYDKLPKSADVLACKFANSSDPTAKDLLEKLYQATIVGNNLIPRHMLGLHSSCLESSKAYHKKSVNKATQSSRKK